MYCSPLAGYMQRITKIEYHIMQKLIEWSSGGGAKHPKEQTCIEKLFAAVFACAYITIQSTCICILINMPQLCTVIDKEGKQLRA